MDRYQSILKRYWGYDDFRGIQRSIIESIGAGHDTLGLMPTGGGKSITFQVPALAMEGVCLVVSPLIALMKDQVQRLRQQGITAAAIYTGLTRAEVLTTLENCIFDGIKFLYVSPERLRSELFINKLKKIKVCFVAIDEAHCISQWGYDFRPSYLQIAELRKVLPHAPMLALTATATPEVVEDIQRQLAFREANVFRMSFERSNLSYRVQQAPDKMATILRLLQESEGSAIVYTRSRRGTREYADMLMAEGITAMAYHAGLTNLDKDTRQQAWQNDEVRVMVATNAFGLGIDKPDVRLVLHADVPDSLEAYFQEAGRAGRDGQAATAILLFNPTDRTKLTKRIADTYPDPEYIVDVYDHLAYFFTLALGDGYDVTYEFSLERFCRTYKYFPVPARSALEILTQAGYIDYKDEEEQSSRVLFLVHREELYRLGNYLHHHADKVVNALLRLYTGLFSEYVYFDENVVATRAGCTYKEVYEALVLLTRHGILNYVPRKRTAHVHYPMRRVLGKDVVLTPAVYAERKAQYATRIEQVVAYGQRTDACRSAMLLAYFGEQRTDRCGVCDYCLRTAATTAATPASIAHDLLTQLRQLGPQPLTQLRQRYAESPHFATAVSLLVADGEAVLVGPYLQCVD